MNTSALVVTPAIAVESKSKNRVLITLEPLQKGFGYTLGNALRRILMSSLTGCAVVEAKIEGALHEYATLEGVQEDVLTILLNLREGAFALTGSRNEAVLELKAEGKGPVTLEAIQLPHDVEIANPEHVIAHLTQAGSLSMTLKIMRGKGEHMASHHQLGEDEVAQDVNVLHVNAIFNPVKKVSYTVDNARVGERTDLDKLIIDLETNGTRTPKSALQEAASIFLDQGLRIMLDLTKPEQALLEDAKTEVDPILSTSIDNLGLSARSTKCLKSEGIYFLGDLVTKTKDELLLTPNLGKRSLKEIETVLEQKSLSFGLGTVLEDWPPADLSYPTDEVQEEAEQIGK